jgi:para-aminobenzoate synthetase/4-amino-4-deoxychorismate lyase
MSLVFLETLRHSTEETKSILLKEPERIIQASKAEDVFDALEEIENAVAKGYLAAGFISYEAGYSFLPNLPTPLDSNFPILWFALSRNAERIPCGRLPDDFGENENVSAHNLQLDLSAAEYAEKIKSIRHHIEKGDTYQVNFTMRFHGDLTGSARGLYKQLRLKQRVPYSAYIETPDWSVISLSPELFFRKVKDRISMRPMKGTSVRGKTPEEDQQLAIQLSNSEKERAENLMIVDLLRNDLGKICKPGTIFVTHPLQIERYETLLQMTSAVEGIALDELHLPQIFQAMFPSGSVTGAPKLRTMQIIHELERDPRRVYTGSIGFVSPEETVFSVAIRTAIVEQGKIEMGVGSGILYEADAGREYQECLLKGRFLTDPPLDFQLIETILWQPEIGYRNLQFHLDRLMRSAEYFVIPVNRDDIVKGLQGDQPDSSTTMRVRLLLDRWGAVEIITTVLEELPSGRVRWSSLRMDSNDVFRYHKTTQRLVYEAELRKAREEGFFEVLFQNERGEVTEGAFSNIWILKDGIYYTPPVTSGLLSGTYRQFLLETKPVPAQERVLNREDVETADAIFISNALRGLMPVNLKS